LGVEQRLLAGAGLGGNLLFALAAVNDSPERADDADESAALNAGISLGGALLVLAKPADHRIAFAENVLQVGLLGGLGEARNSRTFISLSGLFHNVPLV